MTVTPLNFPQIAAFVVATLFAFPIFAQDLDKDEDFERRWKDTPTRQHNWNVHFGGSWGDDDWDNFRVGLLDIGFSTYLHDGSLNLPAELDDFDQTFGGSLNINLHAIRHRLPIVKNNLGIEYGLTVSWKQYRFSNDFQFTEDVIPITLLDDGTSYRKNKLKTTFLEVPLMLTLTPNSRSDFYLSGGVYGGLLLNAKQKLKDEDGNKIRIKDDFNLNKFRYGVVGRIGFGPFAIYGQLALNNLFKENQGPQLQPFNVGISILDF
ncbi:MAG: outer membrane beta-barrel protein [Bacteroidota bacterium]